RLDDRRIAVLATEIDLAVGVERRSAEFAAEALVPQLFAGLGVDAACDARAIVDVENQIIDEELGRPAADRLPRSPNDVRWRDVPFAVGPHGEQIGFAKTGIEVEQTVPPHRHGGA